MMETFISAPAAASSVCRVAKKPHCVVGVGVGVAQEGCGTP